MLKGVIFIWGQVREKHLPHELGHVVQQKEGRVKPTKQLKGKLAVNDDLGLEKEATQMGTKGNVYDQCWRSELKD